MGDAAPCKLGYVPRPDYARIAHMLDAGEPLAAGISDARNDDDSWAPVEFVVTRGQRESA
jgi:hypothetical protein